LRVVDVLDALLKPRYPVVTTKEIPKRELREHNVIWIVYRGEDLVTTKEIPKRELRVL
jgi:hypothetical protein